MWRRASWACNADRITRLSAVVQAQYSRAPQLKATDVLSQLLQSKDPHVAARQNIDSLTEEFFMVSSTYLEMVGVRYEPGICGMAFAM